MVLGVTTYYYTYLLYHGVYFIPIFNSPSPPVKSSSRLFPETGCILKANIKLLKQFSSSQTPKDKTTQIKATKEKMLKKSAIVFFFFLFSSCPQSRSQWKDTNSEGGSEVAG